KTASKNRRERQKAETRQAIMDAASELFLEKGYKNFSLRQVAEQIGYSPGTIYLYFSDRDTLLFTLAEEGFQRFGQTLQAAVDSSDDPRKQITAMGEGYVRFGLENPAHYRLMFMERPDFMVREPAHTEDGDTWADSFMILHNCVERAIEADVLQEKNPRTASDALWAMLHGVVALGIQMPNFDTDRTLDAASKIREVIGRGMLT
ncbi:MAG: TetR/AcrR family transcriptional regulator, partial [Chloroflexota bacterium]